MWNAKTGASEKPLIRLNDAVTALAVLADGRLVAGMSNGDIQLLDPDTHKPLATLNEDDVNRYGYVDALAVMQEERLAALSVSVYRRGHSTKLTLWDLGTLQLEATLVSREMGVETIAVLPDGRLVSGATDGTIRVWSQQDGGWKGVVAFVADAEVNSLATSAPGTVLAARDISGQMHFLALASRRP